MSVIIFKQEWRERQAVSWASIGLLFFVTAFMWAPSQDGLIGVYALAFLLPMLLVLPWQRPVMGLYGGSASIVALLFAGYCTLTVFWGSSPQDVGYFFGVLILLMIWLFGVAWLHQKKPLDLDRLYKLIIVVGVFVGISTLTVFYAQNPVSERLSGWSVARNPIVVAQIFGVAVLLAWVQSWREINQRRSWIYFIAALVSLLPGLMSQSRGPLLALALTLFLAFLLLRPAARVWLPQFALLFVAALVYMALSWTSLDVIKRGFDLTYRDQIWGYVITLIPENFWFGLGVSKDTKLIIADVGIFHHAHNAYLDTLYRTGVFGLILLVAHLGVLLRCWRKNKQLLPLYLWLVFGVLCVMSNTRILFWQLDAKWFLYWIPAGLIAAVQISSLSCMRESKSDRYSAL